MIVASSDNDKPAMLPASLAAVQKIRITEFDKVLAEVADEAANISLAFASEIYDHISTAKFDRNYTISSYAAMSKKASVSVIQAEIRRVLVEAGWRIVEVAVVAVDQGRGPNSRKLHCRVTIGWPTDLDDSVILKLGTQAILKSETCKSRELQ
ncbi:hypothetical protein HDU87_006172 [Geranomyces variabilis]|uniref:Uncharacterized protein n=1 Tax=Geranomyces variabilis TaxID=109894 RepID=A0AAD5TID9_9FUNG|nr:hypothetical protein HDU87_006172 [Geranomyces variabilis]